MSSVYLKPKNIAKIAVLPGILPRLKELFGGFDYLPFLIAQVYKTFGLLPESHPYLSDANIGRYGVLSIFAAAGRELKYNRNNWDKVVLYFASIAAFIILGLMLVSFVLYAVTSPVWASGFIHNIFITPYPETDLAFHLLDKVFGVPGLYDPTFNSTSPFQSGMHAMFRFYSTALFFIAMAYLLYYVFAVVTETSISGTPFGKRFHKIWAPLRIIVALGLLIPFGSFGLNSAQYIVLYAAKFSSSMATNAWIAFNERTTSPFGYGSAYSSEFSPQYYATLDRNTLVRNYGAYQTKGLVAVPDMPDMSELAKHIDIIHTCIMAYKVYHNKKDNTTNEATIKPYLVSSSPSEALDLTTGIPYERAHEFSGYRDIEIVFGEKDDTKYAKKPGRVYPYCGSINIPSTQGGRLDMDEIKSIFYEVLVDEAFNPSNDRLYMPSQFFAERMVFGIGSDFKKINGDLCKSAPSGGTIPSIGYGTNYLPIGECTTKTADQYHRIFFESELRKAFDERGYPALKRFLAGDIEINSPQEIAEYGWAGAGIWYNRIADINADVFAAFKALPTIAQYPVIMEYVRKRRFTYTESPDAQDIFKPVIEGQGNITFKNPKNAEIATILHRAYEYWDIDGYRQKGQKQSEYNVFVRAIAMVFGADPILNVRENENIHPFAKLSAVGKGLIENAILQLGAAGVQSFFGGIFNSAQNGLGGTFTGGAALSKSIAFAGLTSGFILYYIVPFLPFLYFFFAVGSWVKSIFEGMVGAPLWALAHLQFEGDSVMSKQSQGGYFLVLEIFVRPIMTLGGLIASTAIFGASVVVLDLIFDLATHNLPSSQLDAAGGSGPTEIAYYRGGVDQLFFTVMYVILVYLMASSAFKLTDAIPNNIIRWINGGVKSFGDTAGDSADKLTTYASIAGYRFAPQIGQGITGIGEGLGGVVGQGIGKDSIASIVGADAPTFATTGAAAATAGQTPETSAGGRGPQRQSGLASETNNSNAFNTDGEAGLSESEQRRLSEFDTDGKAGLSEAELNDIRSFNENGEEGKNTISDEEAARLNERVGNKGSADKTVWQSIFGKLGLFK